MSKCAKYTNLFYFLEIHNHLRIKVNSISHNLSIPRPGIITSVWVSSFWNIPCCRKVLISIVSSASIIISERNYVQDETVIHTQNLIALAYRNFGTLVQRLSKPCRPQKRLNINAFKCSVHYT